jgi:hypothetical protein
VIFFIFAAANLVAVENLPPRIGGKLGELVHGVLWIILGQSVSPQACGKLFHSFKPVRNLKKGRILRKNGEFWDSVQN